MKPNWFVAAPVPASWLGELLGDLPGSCRGFHPDDVHMTLAFLGSMESEKRSLVRAYLDELRGSAFDISFGSLLALPNKQRVSALSLSVDEGWAEAASLMRAHRDPLLALVGARPDTREPLPHVTVARPKRKAGARGRGQALAWARDLQPPSDLVRIDRVALYTWSQQRRERLFQITDEVALDA